jgi:hypothetical protein
MISPRNRRSRHENDSTFWLLQLASRQGVERNRRRPPNKNV